MGWPLVFGDPQQQENQEMGILLERVALYGDSLSEDESRQMLHISSMIRETHSPGQPIVARLELISASALPLPEDLLPYRRGLVVNEYKVVELLQGELTDPVILVAHWAVLGGKSLPSAQRTVGEIREMRLDSFDNRPELEGERLSMESDNLLLPMYYSVE